MDTFAILIFVVFIVGILWYLLRRRRPAPKPPTREGGGQ